MSSLQFVVARETPPLEPVVLSESLTALVREIAGARLVEHAPMMAGEDFSAYQRVAPVRFLQS